MNKKKLLAFIALCAAIFLVNGIAQAMSTTGTLDVSATIVNACSVTTSPVNFGNVLPSTPSVTAYGDITVHCSSGAVYNIALDVGVFYTYDGGPRVMRNNPSFAYPVEYQLYKDDFITQWGDSDYANTFWGGSSLADTGDDTDQPHPVAASAGPFSGIPAGTTLSDIVTVTVYF